jgi:PhzF family phenazine biosynthesis protein
MNRMTHALRYAAFASTPGGGNPAGIVLDATRLAEAEMQAIAAEIGYAESAFVTESAIDGVSRHLRLRYFSPIAEVPFCGHATIATAVALAERAGVGDFVFETAVGPVTIETSTLETATVETATVETTAGQDAISASFTSVEPHVEDFADNALEKLLALLGADESRLDPRYPPRVSFAGNRHPILVFKDRSEFDTFTFGPAALRALMDQQAWRGTVTTLFAVSPTEFDSRNLFPVGAITEDPATGSAAASLGGYLRGLRLVEPPARVVVTQGSHIGRPSVLLVDMPAEGGIVVTGEATPID